MGYQIMSNKIKIHNVETGEIFERDLTEQEIAQSAIDKAETERLLAERETKAQAKIAAESKLAALGLTTDDLRALGL
jgi:hypothetical protein